MEDAVIRKMVSEGYSFYKVSNPPLAQHPWAQPPPPIPPQFMIPPPQPTPTPQPVVQQPPTPKHQYVKVVNVGPDGGLTIDTDDD